MLSLEGLHSEVEVAMGPTRRDEAFGDGSLRAGSAGISSRPLPSAWNELGLPSHQSIGRAEKRPNNYRRVRGGDPVS